MKLVSQILLFLCMLSYTVNAQIISKPVKIELTKPFEAGYEVKGTLLKKAIINLSISSDYANLSIYANDKLLLDNLDIPTTGTHDFQVLVKFVSNEKITLKLVASNCKITINKLDFQDYSETDIPLYSDISEKAGLDRVNTIKYGGPCVADIDQDGDYDFIVTNHNDETNKLYWNNGDGTVKRHNQDLSRWFMQDLHGASCADYDNDGDLDVIQTKGGGNGKNPSLPDFYRNDNGKLTLVTLDAGITVGARGRGAKWSDMDLDGDLDLVLINAKGIQGETPQHNFYRNKGDGTFEIIRVKGIENADAQRALITDVNNDNIDDFILYDPTNTIWLGNGDFTFTNATSMLPQGLTDSAQMMGLTDVDIDNDGDFDLYFARGNAFGVGAKPSFDFCPVHMRMDIKIRNKGSFELALEAENDIDFHEYDFVGRNGFKGEEFPVYLGEAKNENFLNKGGRLLISQSDAVGWPKDISENGIYFGYIGNGEWRSAVVINGDIFWNVGFSLTGVKNATPEFVRLNRNPSDILLRNDNGKFTDVSKEWNIPQSGNHSGVVVGDFNNDGFNDLFIHRWGMLKSKPADYMLLNTGSGNFETLTGHGAYDPKDEGHGDMGQVFDFDLDGDLDMLNGSDEYSMWYLYENLLKNNANYALVNVGYAPNSKIDAISAEVLLETPTATYRKRVGSSGEIFSQSLLNIVHFGLGNEEKIEKITVKWRNGETVVITDKAVNQIFDTDDVDPTLIALDMTEAEVREGTAINLLATVQPINANKDLVWTSSNEKILKVDQEGKVTAVGKQAKKATIKVTSKKNGLSASSDLKIVKWFPLPVEKVIVSPAEAMIYEGHEIALAITVLPKYADNPKVNWTSSNIDVATINEAGVVYGESEGVTTISAISKENNTVIGTTTIKVEPYHAPGLEIVDIEKFETGEFILGETIDIVVNYSAGSGNHVVAQDLGGVKIWLRQLNERWMSANNFDCIVDAEALGKESGTTTATISLEGLVPTSDLPEGHVYYIYIGMASSNGEIYTKELFPLKFEASKQQVKAKNKEMASKKE